MGDPQDPSTLPATQHEAITGVRHGGYDPRNPPGDTCVPCKDPQCEECGEPEPRTLKDLSQEVINVGSRLVSLASQSELAQKVGLEDIYSKQFSLGLVDLWRVGEELDRRNPHPNMTAEQLAGELGVEQTLKEGGQ